MTFNVAGFLLASAMTANLADRDRATQLSLLGGMMGENLAGVALIAAAAGNAGLGTTTTGTTTTGSTGKTALPPAKVQVPGVPDDQDDAAAVVKARGLRPIVVSVASDDPIGTVIGTDPPAETIVNRGSQVSIEVSAGLLIPDVTTQEIEDAAEAIRTAGFENVSIEASEKSGKHDQAGTVEHQDPVGNSYADASSTVTLYVYNPPTVRAVEVLIEKNE